MAHRELLIAKVLPLIFPLALCLMSVKRNNDIPEMAINKCEICQVASLSVLHVDSLDRKVY